MLRRASLLLTVLAVLAAACGDAGGGSTASTAPVAGAGGLPDDAIAIVASTDLAVGTDRLLLALSTLGNERLGGPDLDVSFRVFPVDAPAEVAVYPATWTWATPGVSGLYRAEIDFDAPGVWAAEVAPAGGDPLEPVAFSVQADPMTPAPGEPAPRSVTPTAADVADLAEITSDPSPDPSLYELSVADAVASGRPTVLVFATPRFCQTAICGPTLDGIKDFAADRPGVNFLHVEVFTNLDDPDNLEVVPAVTEWGLSSEPWIFVLDDAGIVQARFEGVVDPQELAAALDA